MRLPSSSLRAIRFTPFTPSKTLRQCRLYSENIAKVGEILLLKNNNNSNSKAVLTPPLCADKKISLQHDSVSHDDIIGATVGEAVAVSKKRVQYRIHRPTLGEYTDYSPRIVTPIYSQDASLIVSLLDLHPTVPGTSDEKLEIFEAGTGHGALTLFLARAIHGANTAAPEIVEIAEGEEEGGNMEKATKYTEYLSNRRAVLHTLDISAHHSAHAQGTVKNFRNGLYYPHVDFHVGTITEYITSRLEKNDGKPFLDHAILDLPDTHANMEIVGKALKPNGMLITFCPSITQIMACLDFAKERKLPLFLDPVLELGAAGGREWDVRRVRVRESYPGKRVDGELVKEEVVDGIEEGVKESEVPEPVEQRWEMICRPKVGVKVVGGGFVGVWRKKV